MRTLWTCRKEFVDGIEITLPDKPIDHGSMKHCLRVAGNKSFETIITRN